MLDQIAQAAVAPGVVSTDFTSLFASVASLIAILAATVAGYVSLKVKSDLAEFTVKFLEKLDERYVRSREHDRIDAQTANMEAQYRINTKERIGDIEVQVFKIQNDVNIILKDILSAINRQDSGRDERG